MFNDTRRSRNGLEMQLLLKVSRGAKQDSLTDIDGWKRRSRDPLDGTERRFWLSSRPSSDWRPTTQLWTDLSCRIIRSNSDAENFLITNIWVYRVPHLTLLSASFKIRAFRRLLIASGVVPGSRSCPHRRVWRLTAIDLERVVLSQVHTSCDLLTRIECVNRSVERMQIT